MFQYESFRLHVERDGPHDLIFIGNSFTRQGVDIREFEQRLEDRTGRRLRSFNFGAGGTALRSLPSLTQLAYRVDQPGVCVLVITPSMFSFDDRVPPTIVESPYGAALLDPVRRRGALTLWLLDNVELFAQRFVLKNSLLAEPAGQLIAAEFQTDRGFQRAIQRKREDRGGEALAQKRREKFRVIVPNALPLLLSTIALAQSAGAEVWLVEGAMNPAYMDVIERPEQRLLQVRELLLRAASESGAHALLLPRALRFTADEFADVNHLNATGARRLSRWLADSLELPTSGVSRKFE
jgi:hypothetical protein